MSADTVITCHTNADNDALASMVGALFLYPGAVLLFPPAVRNGRCRNSMKRWWNPSFPA